MLGCGGGSPFEYRDKEICSNCMQRDVCSVSNFAVSVVYVINKHQDG
jgi:hypothetical protein